MFAEEVEGEEEIEKEAAWSASLQRVVTFFEEAHVKLHCKYGVDSAQKHKSGFTQHMTHQWNNRMTLKKANGHCWKW